MSGMEDQFGGRTDDDLFYDEFEPIEEADMQAPAPAQDQVVTAPLQPVQTSKPETAAISEPVSTSVSEPVSTSVSEPVSTSVSEPVSTSVEPVSAPVSAAVSTPVEPISAPVSAPVSAAVSTPVEAVSAPASAAVSVPAEIVNSRPGSSARPSSNSGRGPKPITGKTNTKQQTQRQSSKRSETPYRRSNTPSQPSGTPTMPSEPHKPESDKISSPGGDIPSDDATPASTTDKTTDDKPVPAASATSAARVGSGANPRTKLTEAELATKLEQMRLLNAEKTRKFEKATLDERQHAEAFERAMDQAQERRIADQERRRKAEEDKRRLDDEREKNKQRKLKAMGMTDQASNRNNDASNASKGVKTGLAASRWAPGNSDSRPQNNGSTRTKVEAKDDEDQGVRYPGLEASMWAPKGAEAIKAAAERKAKAVLPKPVSTFDKRFLKNGNAQAQAGRGHRNNRHHEPHPRPNYQGELLESLDGIIVALAESEAAAAPIAAATPTPAPSKVEAKDDDEEEEIRYPGLEASRWAPRGAEAIKAEAERKAREALPKPMSTFDKRFLKNGNAQGGGPNNSSHEKAHGSHSGNDRGSDRNSQSRSRTSSDARSHPRGGQNNHHHGHRNNTSHHPRPEYVGSLLESWDDFPALPSTKPAAAPAEPPRVNTAAATEASAPLTTAQILAAAPALAPLSPMIGGWDEEVEAADEKLREQREKQLKAAAAV